MGRTLFRQWSFSFVVALMACFGSLVAQAEPGLNGDYDVSGQTLHGRSYAGQVTIASRGKGYEITWRLDEGDTYRGVALKMDDVLGAVYWSDRDRFRGLGIVIYRISGQELQGVWLVTNADGQTNGQATGRENLRGSPDLSGDYEITLGENPDDMTNYSGHVRMEPHGDTVQVTWYTPDLSYIGNGVRIGDILIVGYALGRAPGTMAYCVGGNSLDGRWTYGDQSALAREVLKRQAANDQGSSGGQATRPCPAAAAP